MRQTCQFFGSGALFEEADSDGLPKLYNAVLPAQSGNANSLDFNSFVLSLEFFLS
jgi:hypothetical protein